MHSKCNFLTVETTCEFLKKHDNYLILAHQSPDGDTIGSAFALKYVLTKLGKAATVKCCDLIPAKYSYITDNQINRGDESTVVCVDVADVALLGSLADDYRNKIDLCIDHHLSNTKYSKNLLLDSDASACCEIIYEIAIKLNCLTDKYIANAIYTGIVTDTGCFKFSNTTAKTHNIVSNLYTLGCSAGEINRIMFETKSMSQIMLEKMALESIEFHFKNKCALIAITNEMISSSGCSFDDLEGITSLPRTIEGIVVGITIKEEGDVFKVSVRTHSPFDACSICANFGGGGHARAAGCKITGTLEEAKFKLLDVVSKVLEK